MTKIILLLMQFFWSNAHPKLKAMWLSDSPHSLVDWVMVAASVWWGVFQTAAVGLLQRYEPQTACSVSWGSENVRTSNVTPRTALLAIKVRDVLLGSGGSTKFVGFVVPPSPVPSEQAVMIALLRCSAALGLNAEQAIR